MTNKIYFLFGEIVYVLVLQSFFDLVLVLQLVYNLEDKENGKLIEDGRSNSAVLKIVR